MFTIWVQVEAVFDGKITLLWAMLPSKTYTHRVDAESDAEKLRKIGFVVEVRG